MAEIAMERDPGQHLPSQSRTPKWESALSKAAANPRQVASGFRYRTIDARLSRCRGKRSRNRRRTDHSARDAGGKTWRFWRPRGPAKWSSRGTELFFSQGSPVSASAPYVESMVRLATCGSCVAGRRVPSIAKLVCLAIAEAADIVLDGSADHWREEECPDATMVAPGPRVLTCAGTARRTRSFPPS